MSRVVTIAVDLVTNRSIGAGITDENIQQSSTTISYQTIVSTAVLTGPDGKSAYQLWLDNGNSGTQQDFIDSLKGDPGQDSTVPGPPGTTDYNDLINTPSIPDAQVNSDWDSSSGVSEILNKPTLGSAAAADTTDFATAAQGSTADTALQPGDNISELTNDSGFTTNTGDVTLGGSQTLTNKTISNPTINNVWTPTGNIDVPAGPGTFAKTSDIPASIVNTVNTRTGTVTLDSSDVGLGNVDNTSDANKPISTATQSALDDKADDTTLISALPSTIGSNNQVIKVVGGVPAWATDANTTYAVPSQAEAETGTATNARAFSAQRVNQAIQALAPVKPTDLAVKGVLAYDVFTSNGTWTKPTGAKVVEVFVIGGGGGGGKGMTGAEGTDRYGGGGGGAGGAVIGQFDADDLTSTVAVTVGVGGAGGTTTGAFDVAPAGTETSFGSYVMGGGGTGGAYGGMVLGLGSGGAEGASSLMAGRGGTSQVALAFGEPGANGHIAGGSSGSSRNASNSQNQALAGGNSSSGAGGTGGNVSNPGGNGVDGTATNGGSGGGGGGKGSVGGNGGFPGGGGGGGGANVTADGAGGNGGSGGNGKAIIISYG